MTTGNTASFFENGTTAQFEYCYKIYPEVLKLKAEKRCKKPQELIRLDQWYQNELPKLIKARGKDAHMVYDELVQTMKWKQSRGKFYPQLSYLVKVNTPRAVMQETKKAFRKLPNLEQAITALSNLKGVGTTMASALLAAAAPDSAPFMADECLMAIPEIEGIDYTTKEYLNFVQHIQSTVTRLNTEVGGDIPTWSPHRVELALWAHYVANDLSPDLLDEMPGPGAGGGSNTNGSINNANADNVIHGGEDTNDADDESLGAVVRNVATESENDNESNPPIMATTLINNSASVAVVSVGVLQDGDSNFVSNDSTSHEPIIDENTTQTTATTSTDGDGEGCGTPLASDSESNLEAPMKAKINAATVAAVTAATAAVVVVETNDVHDAANAGSGVVPPAAAAAAAAINATNCDIAANNAQILPNNNNSNTINSSKPNNNGTTPAALDADVNASAAVAVAEAVGVGKSNGNGALLVSDGENSHPRSLSVNDEEDDDDDASEGDDMDEDDDDDDEDAEDENSNNSREGKSVTSILNNIVSNAVDSSNNDSTLSSAAVPTAIAQKRSALLAGAADGGGAGGGVIAVGDDDDTNSQPDAKKIRSD